MSGENSATAASAAIVLDMTEAFRQKRLLRSLEVEHAQLKREMDVATSNGIEADGNNMESVVRPIEAAMLHIFEHNEVQIEASDRVLEFLQSNKNERGQSLYIELLVCSDELRTLVRSNMEHALIMRTVFDTVKKFL